MREYEVLKPFQHVEGYKRPGDMAKLDDKEAEEKIVSGHVKEPTEPEPVKRKKSVKLDEGEASAE